MVICKITLACVFNLFFELGQVPFSPWVSVSTPRDEGIGSNPQVIPSANTQFSQVVLIWGSGARPPVFKSGHSHFLTTLSESYLPPLSPSLYIRKMGIIIKLSLEVDCKDQVRWPIAGEAAGLAWNLVSAQCVLAIINLLLCTFGCP